MWICELSLESGYAGMMPEWLETLVISVVKLPKMLFTKMTFFHVKPDRIVKFLVRTTVAWFSSKESSRTWNVLYRSKKNKTMTTTTEVWISLITTQLADVAALFLQNKKLIYVAIEVIWAFKGFWSVSEWKQVWTYWHQGVP